MKNHLFLLPVYNDWKSLNILLMKIDEEIKKKSSFANILIINDNSSENIDINTVLFKNIKNLEIVTLKENLGSQRSIAIGLKYILSEEKDCIVTILDSDGEDDPSKVNEMIELAISESNYIVTSNRTNRKENLIFKSLYFLHKIITFLFSVKWISFGNFSSFDSKNLKDVLKNNSVWLAYSSAISQNCNIKRLYARRQQRYFGKSKVNFQSLVVHSLRVISVFYKRVVFFSLVYLTLLMFLNSIYDNAYILLLIFGLIFFNFSILIVRILINTNKLNSWKNNIKDIKRIDL